MKVDQNKQAINMCLSVVKSTEILPYTINWFPLMEGPKLDKCFKNNQTCHISNVASCSFLTEWKLWPKCHMGNNRLWMFIKSVFVMLLGQ